MVQARDCLSCWCSGRTDSCQSADLKLSIMPPPQVIIIIIMKVMFMMVVVFKMKFQGVFQLVEVSGRSRGAPQPIDANDYLKSLPSGQRLQVFYPITEY